MKKIFLYLALIIGLLSLYRCNPIDTLEPDITYRPHYVGPLAFVELDPLEILEVVDKSSTYEISPLQLPFVIVPGAPVNTPAIGPIDFNPKYTELAEIFAEIRVNEVEFTISFTNTFPIVVGAGTTITGRDSLTGTVLFSHVIPQDVQPGQYYSGLQIESNKVLYSDLEVKVENFTSPPANQVVFTGDDLEVVIDIEVLDLEVIRVRPNNSFLFEFETPIDLDFSSDSLEGDVSGYLSVFLRNFLPTTITMELNFLDAQKDTLYKVFATPATIPSPSINIAGDVSTFTELDLVNLINLDTVDIANQAEYVFVRVLFETPPFADLMNVAEDNYFRIQLSANIKATLIDTP